MLASARLRRNGSSVSPPALNGPLGTGPPVARDGPPVEVLDVRLGGASPLAALAASRCPAWVAVAAGVDQDVGLPPARTVGGLGCGVRTGAAADGWAEGWTDTCASALFAVLFAVLFASDFASDFASVSAWPVMWRAGELASVRGAGRATPDADQPLAEVEATPRAPGGSRRGACWSS